MNDEKREQVRKQRRPPKPRLTTDDIMMQLIWLELVGTDVEDLHESIGLFRKAFGCG